MTTADPQPASEASRGRREPPERERFLVWVRAGGCCEICGRYLLEGPITSLPYTLGEVAHIVGRSSAPGSPRGQVEMSDSDRASADNLMLVCPNEHDEIDRRGSLDVATIERLRLIKRDHEELVRRLVSMPRDKKTAILRMIGGVQGEPIQIPREVAAAAVVMSGRFADFAFSFDRQGVEIDLRGIPGEAEGSAAYWAAAMRKIDDVIDTRIADAIGRDEIAHMSVFAFARLPLLVYLGARLDDTFPVAVFQRSRATQAWEWTDGEAPGFTITRPDALAEEITIVLNVSGTVDVAELPEEIRGLPLVTLAVDGTPNPDSIASREALGAFELAIRDLFARLEVPSKVVRRAHVIGALPISAALALGRAHNGPVHPALTIYHRSGSGYVAAVTIT